MNTKPIVWTIAGSDSGGGAGLQADMKAFEAFDVHGCSAVSAITAQNSRAVQQVQAVAPELLDAQLQALSEDLPPAAIKCGMLGSAANVRVVARWIKRMRERAPVALVLDPVWRASTGADLSGAELREVYRRELLPLADVITPNRAEAAWLLGTEMAVPQSAIALQALGARTVLITGGDSGGEQSRDWLHSPQAQGWLSLPRIATPHNHGTGCVFASSLAAALAHGFCAADAAVLAKMATTEALRRGYAAGVGAGPVRPHAGFALRPENLPTLWSDLRSDLRFATLSEPDMGLYAIADSAAWIARLLAAGVRTLQLRIKDATTPDLREQIARSIAAAREADAQLFINDHWALALELGACGVHLGQEDLAMADLQAIADAGLRLGISTHSLWEVARARALNPSYIACGPIHATQTKNMPWRPQGESNLAYWCRVLAEPVVAIAGMDVERAGAALQCGARGVAVLSGLSQAADPDAAVAEYQRALRLAAERPRRASPPWPRPTC
ncbi:bifunctional hydroxymethylpyrimidine kinase/phosphomethylpyrimidine kinase [Roseateles toxinivorans]|uniref:Thiamine-phosphate diphosphorylase n=1 Tax=Roseateles toxinivorans TaxID=270368 RepID=A0A4R6QGV8_9BURK|nr:bifunctional hydroxymethylpyrimidine kinase/phosphomethylpyrimidine kinase [Roseateles toxinivorans]TDP61877.1 thiamine-phosphate diphosphorylase [Roseateles toxinivorans]